MRYRTGNVNIYVIVIIALSLIVAGLGGLSIMLYIDNSDLSNNTESKISVAVAEAVKTKGEEDEAKFAEREKVPNLQFVGPDDYGRLSFSYPKTWSQYVSRDASKGGEYEAYLNPVSVQAILPNNIYALRINIKVQEYSTVLKQFDGLVRSNKLKSSVFTLGDIVGTKYDGEFMPGIRGSQIVLKVRDKTVIIRTDSETFRHDFEALIKTIELNL
jgi:hypothetical protein